MTIINKDNYFFGEIYLPHADSGISSEVKDVGVKIDDFIDEYVPDCLIKSLGSKLGHEFIGELDDLEVNGLKSGADAKWDLLLNGETYDNPNGDEVVWKGIRFKSSSTSEYNKSLLAYYVYYFYESNDSIVRTGAGHARLEAANAIRVSATHKSIKAWRKFITMVQGTSFENPYFQRNTIFGSITAVDYYKVNLSAGVSLYRFIEDKNELVADTYADFVPWMWRQQNQLQM